MNSVHALEEMDEDSLGEVDVRQTLLLGVIGAELTDDIRGTRFVVRGTTRDGERGVELVCRFLPSGLLRIITVYQLKD